MTAFDPTIEQQKAIDYQESMVVIAKPGSGKTFVVSEKVRFVLQGLKSHQGVIAISYTNKASDELKKRCTRNGIDQKSSFFGTVDKFFDGEIIIPFVKQLWGAPRDELQVTKISSLSEEEQEEFADIHENQVSSTDLDDHLDLVKSHFLSGRLFLETNGALALYVLNKSNACQNYIKARYTHVFIDEYQDSGLEQHELFLKLKELGLIAVAVGDADQSIFQFSGKDPKYLLSLARSQSFKSFPITLNHRCHPSLINYSMRFLDKKSALLETDSCQVYKKVCKGDQSAIAAWIDKCLEKAIAHYEIDRFCEVGILVKNNFSGHLINESLKTKHRFFINHPLEEHFSLWARLFCQLLTYKYDKSSTVQEIIDDALSWLSLDQAKELRKNIQKIRVFEQQNLLNLFEPIAELLLPNARSDEALKLLEESLKDDLANWFSPAKDDEVQIMTLHKSKGLEFDLVFHMDLYEWIFPSKAPGPNNDFDHPVYRAWEQDINLHYVGITRAKKACVLCTSTKRLVIDFNTGEQVERNGCASEFLSFDGLAQLRKNLLYEL